MIIDLPLPPSVNRIWQYGGKNVHRAPAYIAWRKECDGLCLFNRWHKSPIRGLYIAGIVLNKDHPRRGDCDNRIKAVLDFLHQVRITDDDRYCQKVSAEWGDAPFGCRVTISSANAGGTGPDDETTSAYDQGRIT